MKLKQLFDTHFFSLQEKREINITVECLDTEKCLAVYALTADEMMLIEKMSCISGKSLNETIKRIFDSTTEEIIEDYCKQVEFYKKRCDELYNAYNILNIFIKKSIIKYQAKYTAYKNPQHSFEYESQQKINAEILKALIIDATNLYVTDLNSFVEIYKNKINE